MRRKRSVNPRVRLHANGRVTLSGLTLDDFRSIITAASLYRHDHGHKPEPAQGGWLDDIIRRNNVDGENWHKNQRRLLDQIDASMKRHYWQPPAKPLKEALRDKQAERAKVKALIQEIFAKVS